MSALGHQRTCAVQAVCPLCANSGHEVVHSTTLSARASNVGTVSAARFRGFRLIANSYFFGAGPGKSLGFSPAVNRLRNPIKSKSETDLYSFLTAAQRERCHNSRRFPISSRS